MWIETIKFLLFQSKIHDNESCPCGSGVSFGNCCKHKIAKQINSKVPPEVQIMKRMRASMKKCCLHPDKEKCKGRIKEAHALQNNKIINLLAGSDRHVYMLNAKRQSLLIPLENGETVPIVEISKISANDATTETCFCDYHDNVAFAAIEKGAPDFDSNSEEMKFVYAYKAFIFEYYKQMMGWQIFQNCFKDNPQAFLDKNSVGMYRMLQMKKAEFEPIKAVFDAQILAGTIEGVSTCVVKIPFQIAFADYAYIAPDYDMDGHRIHHTRKGIMHRLAITVFPEQQCSWLLMSCLKTEESVYKRLFSQAQVASIDKLKFYLNIMLPLYSENMVLSPELWMAWDEKTQMAYTYYANLNGPDARTMSMGIGMGLRNAHRNRSDYSGTPKINLFAITR